MPFFIGDFESVLEEVASRQSKNEAAYNTKKQALTALHDLVTKALDKGGLRYLTEDEVHEIIKLTMSQNPLDPRLAALQSACIDDMGRRQREGDQQESIAAGG